MRHANLSVSFQHTPVSLGHGTKDKKVCIGLGRNPRDCPKSMNVDVCLNDCDDLGHWCFTAMPGVLVTFLRMNRGCKVEQTLSQQGDNGEEKDLSWREYTQILSITLLIHFLDLSPNV